MMMSKLVAMTTLEVVKSTLVLIIIIIIIMFNTFIALFTFTYDQKRFTNFKKSSLILNYMI